MKKLHVNEPLVGLPLPTIEDEGNMILSYFDVFDDVFKTELKKAIKIAQAKPQTNIQKVHIQQIMDRVNRQWDFEKLNQDERMGVIKLYDISKQGD